MLYQMWQFTSRCVPIVHISMVSSMQLSVITEVSLVCKCFIISQTFWESCHFDQLSAVVSTRWTSLLLWDYTSDVWHTVLWDTVNGGCWSGVKATVWHCRLTGCLCCVHIVGKPAQRLEIPHCQFWLVLFILHRHYTLWNTCGRCSTTWCWGLCSVQCVSLFVVNVVL